MLFPITKKMSALIISGILMATAGLVLYFIFPSILNKEINKRLVISNYSETYKYWENVPAPIYLQFYFFNITNTQEIWDKTSKPVLEELGPYTFRETREKVNVTFNDNNTVSYRQVRRWYFEEDRTNGTLEDVITTLNVPMVAAALQGKKMNREVVYFALEELFSLLHCTWFIKKTVRELLFEGYDDRLMELAKRYMKIPYDKFGWFYKRNGTDDGEMTAFTGEGDINVLDEINTWKDMLFSPAYESPCNMLNGSAGDLWPPVKSQNQKVALFVPEICRSLTFTYLTNIESNGIRAYRFWADGKQLDNGKYNADHKCFCSHGKCLPAGGLDASSCNFDAPAVVSYPHFLLADPVYSEGVIGLKPNMEKHRMYLDIIPEMGVPVGVAARMQINIIFEDVPNITQFENVTERIYWPIFWFSETAELDDGMASKLKMVLNTLPLLMNLLSIFLVTVGSVPLITVLVHSILYILRKNEPTYSTVLSEN